MVKIELYKEKRDKISIKFFKLHLIVFMIILWIFLAMYLSFPYESPSKNIAFLIFLSIFIFIFLCLFLINFAILKKLKFSLIVDNKTIQILKCSSHSWRPKLPLIYRMLYFDLEKIKKIKKLSKGYIIKPKSLYFIPIIIRPKNNKLFVNAIKKAGYGDLLK